MKQDLSYSVMHVFLIAFHLHLVVHHGKENAGQRRILIFLTDSYTFPFCLFLHDYVLCIGLNNPKKNQPSWQISKFEL